MRPSLRVLPAVVATVCLGISTLTPVAAFADEDHSGAEVSAVLGDVAFASATSGTVTLRYSCDRPDPEDSASSTLQVSLQRSEDDETQLAHGQLAVSCDGGSASAVVPLTADVAEVLAGPAFLSATLGHDGELEQAVAVVRTDTAPSDPSQAAAALTIHASPRSVKEGKKITVKGTIARDGKPFKAAAVLELAPDSGGGFAAVKTVQSRKGRLSTTVRATASGTFRFTYAGDATTAAGASAGAHVVVKVKHKKHH